MSDVRLLIEVCYEPDRRWNITVSLTVLQFMDWEQENNTQDSQFMDHTQVIKHTDTTRGASKATYMA